MKYLVTGANGFIGSKLLKLLSENGNSVIAIIRGKDSNIDNITGIENIKFVYCNMDNIERIVDDLDGEQIDCCIHLAWQGANGDGRKDVELQLKNVSNTINLCYALSKLKINRFVGVGSIVETDANYYVSEDGTSPNELSYYGVAKHTAYFMSKITCSKLGIDHLWLRLANVYGIGDSTPNFIKYAVSVMLKGDKAEFTTGEQLRDFIVIDDAVNGIYAAAINGIKNTSYYVGSSHPRKLREYIYQIREYINPKIELFMGAVPFYGVSLPMEEYDCSKIMKDTGYYPKITFEEGLEQTVKWMKKDMNYAEGV